MTMNYYTIADIENIKFSGFSYVLPEKVLEILKILESELQITNVDSTETSAAPHKKYEDSSRTRRHPDRNYRNPKPKELTNDDWEMIRSFKTTKIEKKEGVEKNINQLRILLNKISNKNYDTQKTLILDSVAEFLHSEGSEEEGGEQQEDMDKITQAIFDIVCSNKFFSEIYAQLFKELVDRFPVFLDILMKYIEVYKTSIDNIYFVDPNKDYDGFCSYTKINENRRAMTLFMINLYKIQILKETHITDLLHTLLIRSLEYIDSENRTNELEEITENVFLIISNIHLLIAESDEWTNGLLPIIIQISQMKFKEHKSLSNRVVFKYMDIIDSVEN